MLAREDHRPNCSVIYVFQGSARIFILEMSKLYEMEELAGMKRSELQKLAKQHGIKANMKTDGLIKALAAVVVGSNLEGNNNIVPAASSEEEATTTSASSTEDQSEVEASEEKQKTRRGRGRKQKNVKQTIMESPVKDTKTDVVAGGDNVVVTTFPTPESESQTSSVNTEDEVSPVAKKSKAKPKGRGRGRRGRQTKEEPMEEEKKTEQVFAPVAAVIPSPAVTGRRSRSLQRTSAVIDPTLPTPPNSGSSRKTKRAIRRVTHTPQPAAPAQPALSTQTPDAAPSSNKRSSRGANKTPLTATPKATPKTTPTAIKTTMEAKTRGSTGKRSASGSAGGKAKKVRRGTFDKSPAKEVAVEATKSSSSLKDEIMAEIDRKVQIQVAKSKSCIPTIVQATKKKTPGKNWSKTHHGALDKMESIDSYLERKQRRAEAISASKKPRIPAITKPVLKAAKSFNFASPKPGTTKSQTFSFASPKPTKTTMPTNPKSVNPKTVSFKVSKLKTPKKVILPCSVAAPAIDKRKSTPGVRKSISALTPGSGVRKSIGGVTPVNQRKSFGGAKTPSRKSVGGAVTPFGKTAASATKPNNMFDIKASLSKPLAYKPHTGKLKPFGQTQQNSPSNLSKAKAAMKKPQLKGRDVRRAGNRINRAQKRNDSYMANRGIAGC